MQSAALITPAYRIHIKDTARAVCGRVRTKLAARLKFGKTAAADPSLFIDWKRRLLAMGRAEARRLGLPWNRVGGWKRTVRKTGTLRGDALRRLKRALLSPSTASPTSPSDPGRSAAALGSP